MKLKLLLLLLTTMGVLNSALSQEKMLIKGNVWDSSINTHLEYVSVLLLRTKDSTLVTYGRTDKQGSFTLETKEKGSFILLLDFPEYVNYYQILDQEKPEWDLGQLSIVSKAHMLKEVIVQQKVSAIKIKGDTTEFAADSFHVQPNASVEDLLKIMPGFQVDKDGHITAQGQTIKKVLVEGEEFFGDDPTLVTKNLRADMVDKVQVYDKKSDQAAFTGIDDGVKDKTINLKLKENQKKGVFGKVQVGAGPKGFHENQGMLNKFNNKEKMAVFGIVANTGKAGLGWEDQQSYGGGSDNVTMTDDGGLMIFSSSDDEVNWNGNYNGQGRPLSQSAGLHYDNKWNNDKSAINGNYKFNRLSVVADNNTISQNNLSTGIQYSNNNTHSKNISTRNKINGSYELQIDSTSSIKANIVGNAGHKNTLTDAMGQTTNEAGSLLNDTRRTLTNIGDNNSLNSDILYRKKFKKTGRTLSFALKENYSKGDYDGYLYAKNNFYTSGVLDSTSLTDQYKKSKDENFGLDTKLTYTEPLSRNASLLVNYGIVIANSNSLRNSYNKSASGRYDDPDSIYSNHYRYDQFMHRTGLFYNYSFKKVLLNFGSNVGFNKFDQKNVVKDSIFHRSFVNWYPQLRFRYKFSGQKSLEFNYNGSTSQPSMTQIQPVATNNDPLNVYLGNADLKPTFRNSISVSYNSFNMLSNIYYYGGIYMNTSSNSITTSTNTDSVGKSVFQYINVNGVYSYNFYGGMGGAIKKWDVNFNLNTNGYRSHSVNFVNGVENNTNSGNYGLSGSLSKSKEKKYSIELSANGSYNTNVSSLQKDVKNNYWSYSMGPDILVYLPGKIQLHTDAKYSFQQKTQTFSENIKYTIWNAWLGKTFFKSEELMLRASVNDLLNQNRGINRYASSNIITQSIYTNIKRYFQFSILWNFKRGMGAGTK